jgi:tRNA-specific adenosine deaminase 1
MAHPPPDEIAALVHAQYASLKFQPPPRQFTVLAAFVCSSNVGSVKVISLGSGSKCLPTQRLQHGGELVHDSHAEILARRGASRFFMEEVGNVLKAQPSPWIEREEGNRGKFKLREGIKLHLYVSTPPCKLI